MEYEVDLAFGAFPAPFGGAVGANLVSFFDMYISEFPFRSLNRGRVRGR